jgi:hypothetical protein
VLRGPALPFEADVLWVGNPRDGSFGKAFSYGTTSDAEQRAFDMVPGALVLSLPVDLHRERTAVASLVQALAACGALAVRFEESKLGYPIARWLELVSGPNPWSLYRAVIVMLGDGTAARTCGMHAFSLPDAQISLDEATDATAANALLGALNVFQISEDPLLLGGHTFAPDASTPRRVLQRWPDDGYPAGHACHNPFGVWRLGPPGGEGVPGSALAFTFMPALAVLLLAAEQKHGRPLTRAEVEQLTADAVGMSVKHEDARALERERGYADLDPRHVWEQWQIFRRTHGPDSSDAGP